MCKIRFWFIDSEYSVSKFAVFVESIGETEVQYFGEVFYSNLITKGNSFYFAKEISQLTLTDYLEITKDL